jgi:hypothetical protein
MRLFSIAALAAGFCAAGCASTVYTDTISNTDFAGATYYLDANGLGAITTAIFSDGTATTSGTEMPTSDNTRIPDSSVITLDPNFPLVSAVYTLTYSFDVVPGKSVSYGALPTPHKSNFSPGFSAENEGDLTLDLVFYAKSGSELLDYSTSLTGSPFTMDLTSLIETGDGGTILSDYENKGIYIKSVISDSNGVVFTADTSNYTTLQDENVDVTYNVKERLSATSTLDVTTVPEPAGYGLFGLGLLAIGVLKGKRAA